MSSSSLSYTEDYNIHIKDHKTFKQKTLNYYEPDKPNNKVLEIDSISSKQLDLFNNEIVKTDDTSIYHEIVIDQNFEESAPSTPTSLYDYINFADNSTSERTSNYYHYPVFKFKNLNLDDSSSLLEKSEYLSLYDVSLKTSKNFQVVKERFLAMSLFEKRQLYKCGYNFVTLEEIPTWAPKSATVVQYSDSSESVNNKISIFTGNIITLEIDAIVNSTNVYLRNGGNGVDGCIHFAAGKKYLQAECESLNGCERGECKITGGYRMPAKYIIHCVGPIGENAELLSSCYKNALDTLKEYNLRSIAFPCISTGAYRYPKDKAVQVVLKTIKEWLENPFNFASIDRIIFVLFLNQDIALYNQYLPEYFPR